MTYNNFDDDDDYSTLEAYINASNFMTNKQYKRYDTKYNRFVLTEKQQCDAIELYSAAHCLIHNPTEKAKTLHNLLWNL